MAAKTYFSIWNNIMKITIEAAKTEKIIYYCARAEGKEISSSEEYEQVLYKVAVQHLNIFNENNWGEFEYLTWMAAVEHYEIKHGLPRKLSKLRFELEKKHIGFFIEGEERPTTATIVAN